MKRNVLIVDDNLDEFRAEMKILADGFAHLVARIRKHDAERRFAKLLVLFFSSPVQERGPPDLQLLGREPGFKTETLPSAFLR